MEANNNEQRTKRGGYGCKTDAEWEAYKKMMLDYYANASYTGD